MANRVTKGTIFGRKRAIGGHIFPIGNGRKYRRFFGYHRRFSPGINRFSTYFSTGCGKLVGKRGKHRQIFRRPDGDQRERRSRAVHGTAAGSAHVWGPFPPPHGIAGKCTGQKISRLRGNGPGPASMSPCSPGADGIPSEHDRALAGHGARRRHAFGGRMSFAECFRARKPVARVLSRALGDGATTGLSRRTGGGRCRTHSGGGGKAGHSGRAEDRTGDDRAGRRLPEAGLRARSPSAGDSAGSGVGHPSAPGKRKTDVRLSGGPSGPLSDGAVAGNRWQGRNGTGAPVLLHSAAAGRRKKRHRRRATHAFFGCTPPVGRTGMDVGHPSDGSATGYGPVL